MGSIHAFALGRCARGRVSPMVAIFAGLLLWALSPPPAAATVTAVTPKPFAATTCDSVAFVVSGVLSDPCYQVTSVELRGPLPLECIGCPTTYVVEITARKPNPAEAVVCATVLTPYERSVEAGRLAAGRYRVIARERLFPFSPDSTVAIDSSEVEQAFQVYAAGCPPPERCQLLDFAPPRAPLPLPFRECDALGVPGGRAVFDVTLNTPIPVGGVQTDIDVFDLRMSPLPGGTFTPVSVEPVGRAGQFQVAWTADGSRARVLLYSTSGATITPGSGPILRVGYSIGADTREGRYMLGFGTSIVSDSEGVAIPPCPTLAVVTGALCVVAHTCDLNSDGRSDILDVIRLVHCALGDRTEVCPDSVAAKADCNQDGSVDIRDVVCCVRRILLPPCDPCAIEAAAVPLATRAVERWGDTSIGGLSTAGGLGAARPAAGGSGLTQLGFTGPARWINAVEGRATIVLEPASDLAGIEFMITREGSGVARIGDIHLETGSTSDRLEWVPTPDGSAARVMLFATTSGPHPAGPVRLVVGLQRQLGVPGVGRLTLSGVLSGNSSAEPITTESTGPTAEIPATSDVGAPFVFGVRPNPFHGTTEIMYVLPTPAHVSIRVYNVDGRLIRTLRLGNVFTGIYRETWDGRDEKGRAVGSGIYFARFDADRVSRVERLMLLR